MCLFLVKLWRAIYISAAQAIYMYMHQHVYTPLAEAHICVDACVFV